VFLTSEFSSSARLDHYLIIQSASDKPLAVKNFQINRGNCGGHVDDDRRLRKVYVSRSVIEVCADVNIYIRRLGTCAACEHCAHCAV
jgi:hypothetical protein